MKLHLKSLRNILWWLMRSHPHPECVKNVVNSFDFSRVFCMCLEACWILRTLSADVPSGCLTLQKWVNWQGKKSSLETQMPTNRKGHSGVVLGSAMLLYGGLVDIRGSSQEFWSLDFDTMAWSLLTGSSGPGPRHSHSAMVYQDYMYLFGGLKGLREQRDFWQWNSTNDMWTLLRTKSGPSKLMGHSAVAYKDSMLLFGGGESQNSPNNCLWRYSFATQTWQQLATLPGSKPPDKIHHCCTGLGPRYSVGSLYSCSGLQPRLDDKLRPFKNRCFPAPLTFLGSEVAIELQTLSLDKSNGGKGSTKSSDFSNGIERAIGNNLTFENKAFRKQWNTTEEDLLDESDGNIVQHQPDLLLVLGGRPCSIHSPLSLWQMTLSD
ncbi:tRNA wybutosine-synthesizing protein 2/3/4 isoform X2 [Echeneis naucrates]|uniref:tRNA wybutosine-synthesizing protein 2/3/4 isoform X2 n=1 Tax=Echeneis naucrates TaxID=173247 RepID=UPI001113E248|nr:tRNA wybutosine-synthesizing protein 2/3/4-like isoform X2 [Echeneis naucrates]XP_029386835.1 tRNA wybutosine-synthesizing protein 2/3/4-like isoform X2 [Echeneis naucrates]XP_029386836.1 tRNA wybutosine-synthesizing protein 2/3/4-like isoform X2 [Echeneis naucrates]XP_029386837.1 tRNA wybutosine-synthesizing protein 2/3/4-like isoform X2 [Echeneis naucrates]XP_029386838.1 tRNA wybutosine-synthesizing protein 2/3/4-like isoform X2 [Echeneis naucrates]